MNKNTYLFVGIILVLMVSNLKSQDILPSTPFPDRPIDAIQGDVFIDSISSMSMVDRENLIFKEISEGNMPSFCKQMKSITIEKDGKTCTYHVTLDYLAVGSDSNFCRIPMSPELAQRIADHFDCSMPTPKMVDHHWQNANRKINPITHTPNGNDNEQVWMFALHNTEIEDALEAIGAEWDRDTSLVDGLKKDVVITNRLATNPGKVAIYGWYKLDGTYWQPIYTGHTSNYMDYSHGIRLVNRTVYVDDNPIDIRTVLADVDLYKLLSNETGIMEQPYYLYGNSQLPAKPNSFGIKIIDKQSIKLQFNELADADEYEIYQSSDGLHFNKIGATNETAYTISELIANQQVFLKLKAKNATGSSLFSEALVATPSDSLSELLIVQGFDRATSGNSFDFMKYHATSASANAISFDAATNEAVTSGLFDLTNYKYVDYVLGEESTVDETYSSQEQAKVTEYLKQGGSLLVSGAEIAWDLDYKGSTSDKIFYNNYLKSAYQYDAPFNTSGTYYTVKGTSGSYFENMTEFNFDNGSQGTINVKYADQLEPMHGSESIFEYVGPLEGACAGVAYSGYFSDGASPGKVICLGFPLETVYDEVSRNAIFKNIFDYFKMSNTQINDIKKSEFSIYPNPLKDNFTLKIPKPIQGNIEIVIIDKSGKIQKMYSFPHTAGNDELKISVSDLKADLYFCRINSAQISTVEKLLIVN